MFKINLFRDNDIKLITDNIDNLQKKGEIKKRQLLGPFTDIYKEIKDIVFDFIKRKKRIIYGGMAWDLLIKTIKPNDSFYTDDDTPDIDFYSPDPINDLKELCDLLFKKNKYDYISGINGSHEETYKIYINFFEYCNITYMPSNIFYSILYIPIDNLRLIHPKVALIDLLRQYNDPINSFWRLEKVFKRGMLLLKHYPLEVSNKEQSLSSLDKSINIALFILNHIIKLSNNSKYPIIFIGYFAFDAFFNPNKKLDQQTIEFKNVPLECISSNLDEDVKNIYNTILKYYMDNNQNDRFNDEIKIIEYQPFFQFFDKRIEFLYKGEVFLTIYGNNDYCIPFQLVHYKKYSVYIGTFNVCFMYLLTKFHYQYINKDKDGSYLTNYLLYLLNKSKDEFLNKNKVTLLDPHIFEDFKIECFGKTFDSIKIGNKKFIDTKRGLIPPGRSRISPYDPQDQDNTFNPDNYKFSNSSGNPIINPKELIIQINNKSND